MTVNSPPYKIIHGDCLDLLPPLPDESVQLVVTSPPYAEQRKKLYGGPSPDEYVEWFLPIAAEIPIRSEVTVYPLEQANEALVSLKREPVRGAKVLLL